MPPTKAKNTETIQTIIQQQKISEWIDKDAPLYQATLSDFPIEFALGKHQLDPDDNAYCFLPMYARSRGKIRYAIGYYRIKQADYADAVLDSGAMDMEKLGQPHFLKKIGKKTIPFGLKFIADYLDTAKQNKKPTLKPDLFPKEVEAKEEEEEDEDISLFHIKKPATPDPEETLFEKKATKLLPPLPEQTEEMMEKQQTAFRKDPPKDASWVARFMLDDNYTLESPPKASADSLLECLTLALEYQGMSTTVDKIRKALSQQATQQNFEEEKALFHALNLSEQYSREDKAILQERKRTILKNLALPTLSDLDKETLTEEQTRLDKTIRQKTDQEDRLQELKEQWVPTLSESATLESYRSSLRTSHPLNTPLLGLLERILRIKLVFFVESQAKESPDFVINTVPSEDAATPRFYILLSVSHENKKQTPSFDLIRYQSRGILTPQELPFAIRARFQTRAIETEDTPSLLDSPLTPSSDPTCRLILGSKAPTHTPVGFPYLDIERIPWSRLAEFLPLNQMPPDWRRRLSDEDMMAKFQLDGHTWHSVFHYVHAQPYKEKLSEYVRWTAGQEYSKEPGTIKRAKKAAKELGGKVANPEKSRIDAWQAKYQQNEDVRSILKATQDATLLHFRRGHPATPDILLMQLRSQL